MADVKVNGTGKKARDSLPEGWKQWVGIAQVRAATSASYLEIKQAARDGIIDSVPAYLTPEGKALYNPADIPKLEGYLEEQAEERKDERKPTGLTHEEFSSGTDLVKQVHKHQELMLPLLVDGWRQMVVAAESRILSMTTELQAKNARISELEKERDLNAAQREKNLSEEHSRILAEKAFEAHERRKDRAFGVFENKLAPVLLQKMGFGDPKVQAGLEFLKTIRRDQILGLLAIGVLDEAQTKLARALIAPITPEEEAMLKGSSPQSGEVESPA